MNRRRALYGFGALVVGLAFGSTLIAPLSAAPGPPDAEGIKVVEQNLDADGNIRVHEQGVVRVSDNDGSLTVDGTVAVSNLPAVPTTRFESLRVLLVIGGGSLEEFEVPSGVVVTDLVATGFQAADNDCEFTVIGPSGDEYAVGTLEDGFALHLTTGIPGPFTIQAQIANQVCSARLLWTGYESS